MCAQLGLADCSAVAVTCYTGPLPAGMFPTPPPLANTLLPAPCTAYPLVTVTMRPPPGSVEMSIKLYNLAGIPGYNLAVSLKVCHIVHMSTFACVRGASVSPGQVDGDGVSCSAHLHPCMCTWLPDASEWRMSLVCNPATSLQPCDPAAHEFPYSARMQSRLIQHRCLQPCNCQYRARPCMRAL